MKPATILSASTFKDMARSPSLKDAATKLLFVSFKITFFRTGSSFVKVRPKRPFRASSGVCSSSRITAPAKRLPSGHSCQRRSPSANSLPTLRSDAATRICAMFSFVAPPFFPPSVTCTRTATKTAARTAPPRTIKIFLFIA